MKNEAKVTKETLAEVERRMKNYYVLHFDHWMNLFSDFKQNCDFQLKRKQVEIVKLEEAVVNWQRKYKNVQRKVSWSNKRSPRSRTDLSFDYYDGLMKLCSAHPLSPTKTRTPQTKINLAFSPRATESLMTNMGDNSPVDSDQEDFKW